MKFSGYERVEYLKNPLTEVICQLQFPQIFELEDKKPYQFEKKIGNNYPYKETSNNFPPEIYGLLNISQMRSNSSNFPVYKFFSMNRKTTITLSREYIGFSALEYHSFSDYFNSLREVLNEFEKIYKPKFYTRIGLRYQNLIFKSNLEKDDQNLQWKDLIKQEITPEFYNDDVYNRILGTYKELSLKGDNNFEIINFKHGLVDANKQNESKIIKSEQAYLLDIYAFEFRPDVIDKNNVDKQLRKFNETIRNIFRSSISEDLHRRLEPQQS